MPIPQPATGPPSPQPAGLRSVSRNERQETITLWGRTHPLPRLTCWLGDPGCSYTYSGVRNAIEPWSQAVSELRALAEETVGCRFNSLLLNRYRDGCDKLDWHADDEVELSPEAPIAHRTTRSAASCGAAICW